MVLVVQDRKSEGGLSELDWPNLTAYKFARQESSCEVARKPLAFSLIYLSSLNPVERRHLLCVCWWRRQQQRGRVRKVESSSTSNRWLRNNPLPSCSTCSHCKKCFPWAPASAFGSAIAVASSMVIVLLHFSDSRRQSFLTLVSPD